MMFEFFVTHILKRSVSLPLSLGFVYPLYNGDLVVRSSTLTPPPAAGIAAEVEIPYARVNPKWRTLDDEVIEVRELTLRDLRVVLDVRRPAEVLHCLQNRQCANPSTLRAGLRRSPANTESDQVAPAIMAHETLEREQPRAPLRMRTSILRAEGGALVLKNAATQRELEIVLLRGSNLSLPLREEPFSLHADLLLHESNIPRPIRARVEYEPGSQSFSVFLNMKGIPIAVIESLLPELSASLHGFGSEGRMSGELSGELALRFLEASGRWELL